MTTASSVNVPSPQSTQIAPTISGVQSGVAALDPYTSAGASTIPYAQSTFQSAYNNPYAGQLQGAAGTAAGLGTSAATSAYNTGGAVTNAGLSLVPGASAILQQGFDPQNQLYAQQFAQQQNQSNVNNANAGVANTPYGAGVTDYNNSLFNLNWQNQQLGRESTALGAASGAVGQAGNTAAQGTQTQASAAPLFLQSAAYPYATNQTITGNQTTDINNLLQTLTGGANLQNLSTQDLLNLLSGQNNANSVANQAAQTQLNQTAQEWAQLSGIGSGLGSVGSFLYNQTPLFGGTPTTTGP